MIKQLLPRPFFCMSALLAITLSASPAFAVNKDMVQLQTQIQDLQDAVTKLQQSNDERMGVLRDLVQQSADSVNKMSLTLDTLQKQVRGQQDAEGGKVDQIAGQVQSLNDSVDEIKARLNQLEKSMQEIQNQQQSTNAYLQNLAPPGGLAPGAPAAIPGAAPQPGADLTPAGPPAGAVPGPPAPAAAGARPVGDLYKVALSDYMSAKYTVATAEFADVVKTYPAENLAGNAYYYMGEIDYRAGRFAAAVKDYDHVLDQYPDNSKIAVSHLHKGQALLALKQNDAGVRELRTLIQRFPTSPEASQARSRLNGLGIPIAPRP
jgi:TolA-binding protein